MLSPSPLRRALWFHNLSVCGYCEIDDYFCLSSSWTSHWSQGYFYQLVFEAGGIHNLTVNCNIKNKTQIHNLREPILQNLLPCWDLFPELKDKGRKINVKKATCWDLLATWRFYQQLLRTGEIDRVLEMKKSEVIELA